MINLEVALRALMDYQAHTAFDQPIRAIAKKQGIKPNVVSKRIRAIEKARDVPEFNALITPELPVPKDSNMRNWIVAFLVAVSLGAYLLILDAYVPEKSCTGIAAAYGECQN